MSSRVRQFSFVASLAALIIGGSAAGAMPTAPHRPPALAPSSEPEVFWPPGLEYLRNALTRSGPAPVNPEATVRPPRGGDVPTAKPVRKDAYAGLPADAFAGYATATVFHTDPELATDNEGDDFGAEYDLGLSDAAHASVPVPAVTDELGRKAIPALETGHSFGQGQGIKLPAVLEDFDLGFDPTPAIAKAPPSSAPVQKSGSAQDLEFVKADSFEAEALAKAIRTGCVIGDDLARGLGAANQTAVDPDADFDDEDDPLLSVSVDDPPPPRAVSQSTSRVALSRQPVTPGHFGGIAETRLTVAPITFGIPGEKRKDDILFTLELAGEFVLRAAADGKEGKLFFGPDGANDARPVARLFHNGKEIGGAGFGEIVPIKVGDDTVGEIRIGDDPHAIGDDSEDKTITGTRVAAAADVAVVRFFTVGAQQRVGHMEVDLTVPSDGVSCPGITLSKRSDPASVTPGAPFSFTIDVSNPNDCMLSAVKVKDNATTEPGVSWKVLTTLPRSTISKEGVLTFDLESLRPGERKTIKINAESAADTKPGTVTNQATAAGVCSKVPLTGASTAVATIGSAATVPAAPRPSPPPAVPSVPASQAAASASARTSTQASASDTPRATASGATKSRSSSGVLARTGASLPLIAVAVPLIVGGRVLRRLRRVRTTEES